MVNRYSFRSLSWLKHEIRENERVLLTSIKSDKKTAKTSKIAKNTLRMRIELLKKIIDKSFRILEDSWSPINKFENTELGFEIIEQMQTTFSATDALLMGLHTSLKKAYNGSFDTYMFSLKSNVALAKLNSRQARNDVRSKSDLHKILNSISHYKHHWSASNSKKSSSSVQRLLCLRSLELLEYLNEEISTQRRGAIQDIRACKSADKD